MKESALNVCGRSRKKEQHTTPSFLFWMVLTFSPVLFYSDFSLRRWDGRRKTLNSDGGGLVIASKRPSCSGPSTELITGNWWCNSTTPACLTPTAADTHGRTRTFTCTHKHEKCWVTICKRGIRLASAQLAGRSDKTPNMLPNGPGRTNEKRRRPLFFLDSLSSSTFVLH